MLVSIFRAIDLVTHRFLNDKKIEKDFEKKVKSAPSNTVDSDCLFEVKFYFGTTLSGYSVRNRCIFYTFGTHLDYKVFSKEHLQRGKAR